MGGRTAVTKNFGNRLDLVGMEDNPQAGLLPNPMNTSARHGIEEAEIQENYGEVPGRLTDQGDRPQTPLERHRTDEE